MIKIPAKVRYAVRTLVELGKHQGKVISLREIENIQEISAKFTKQIMQPLEKADIVKSKRGITGGYYLNKPPARISLMDIINCFNKEPKIAPCVSGDNNCDRNGQCKTRVVWEELQGSIDHFFTHKTLDKIIKTKNKLPEKK